MSPFIAALLITVYVSAVVVAFGLAMSSLKFRWLLVTFALILAGLFAVIYASLSAEANESPRPPVCCAERGGWGP